MSNDNQIPLDFENNQVRLTDPSTSRDALRKLPIGKIRKAIIATLLNAGARGLATFEIAKKLKHPRDYISPHMKKLLEARRVYKLGITRVNPDTKTKAESEVYAAYLYFDATAEELAEAQHEVSTEHRFDDIVDIVKEITALEPTFELELRLYLKRRKHEYAAKFVSDAESSIS